MSEITHGTEAYALGYYQGRCVGNDEPLEEIVATFPAGWRQVVRAMYRAGYERGVSDYCVEAHPDEE